MSFDDMSTDSINRRNVLRATAGTLLTGVAIGAAGSASASETTTGGVEPDDHHECDCWIERNCYDYLCADGSRVGEERECCECDGETICGEWHTDCYC